VGFHCTEHDLSRSSRPLSDLVAPGIRRIAIPLPIRGLSIVNAYLVEGAHGWSLVDAGMHTAEAEQALRAGLADAGIGLEDVTRVFVTHLHPDHMGMAGTLERAGADVLMHTPEIAAARRVWSKGHEMIDASYEWFVRHGMPRDIDEGMRQAWIAMGARVDDLAGRIDELLAHHAARLDATIAAVGTSERDAYTIARMLFPVLRSPHEERFALAETLAHLRHLERKGRVREIDGSPARWSVTHAGQGKVIAPVV